MTVLCIEEELFVMHVRTSAVESTEESKRELEHRKLAREAAAEGIVLLENDGTLPIAVCSLALFGAGAATTIKGGTGSGEVNERYSVTIEKGLVNAGFTVTTGAYLREYEKLLHSEKEQFNKALARKFLRGARDLINVMSDPFQYPSGRLITDEDVDGGGAEICIYVIARQGGECSDRKLDKYHYNFTQTEIDNLKFVTSKYSKTIVVINAGGQMDLHPLDDVGVNAVVFFGQQGMEGGSALADLLTGAVNPSGCLAATWPEKYEDVPNAMEYSYLKGHTDFDEYKEGIYVGYRYYDSFCIKPRYEFGYGLSYTEFSVEVSGVRAEGTDVIVTVKITNTGTVHSGKKTIQLYVSAPGGRLNREHQSLAAFGKTDALSPGGSQELTLAFPLTDLAGYNEESASFTLEQGDYIIRIGGSSRSTVVAAVVNLDEAATTEECMNLCKPAYKFDEIWPANAIPHDVPDDVIRVNVSAAEVTRKTHHYKMPEPEPDDIISSILNKLSIEDKVKCLCGTGVLNKNPAYMVPGAAGYTTSHLAGVGVPNAALCDGPAGLRLQRRAVRLKNGKVKPTDAPMELLNYLPGILKMALTANPDKGTLLYQYTSAFPAGSAQAQTWNTALLERVGDAIGAEMEEYGATWWLAPGMNIHRNPLCGRNFEYYSEDPLLTGKLAAAVTRGVQRHEGCYVTIKHFAANNQEDNRNKSDSRLSERVLREIYLKGFRIAVEEGGAKSVMTSYNKLNGVYTPNSYDLCTNLLRCEWGFDGVVMSDWLSTGKGLACNGAAIKAGNDLIMPGGKYYRKMIKKSLASGALSESELNLSCARVLKDVLNGRTGMMKVDFWRSNNGSCN